VKNLYIVSSPFQTLCATEAKFHFQTKNNILLIVNYSKDSHDNIHQIQNIVQLSSWDEIIIIGESSKESKYKEYMKNIFTLKKYKYEFIFVGHFGQFQSILLANLVYKNLYVIDDGVITLELHKKELNPFVKKKREKFLKRVKFLRYKIFALRLNFDKKKINYFTMFALQAYYGEKIVHNNFIFMKQLLQDKQRDKSFIYFLGQPLFPSLIKEDDYIEALANVKRFFQEKHIKVIYIPHRRESHLESIASLEDDFFTIEKFSDIIEAELLKKDVLPMGIYSFLSTALFSLSSIYDTLEIAAFELEIEKFLTKKEAIVNVYKTLEDNNISIIRNYNG